MAGNIISEEPAVAMAGRASPEEDRIIALRRRCTATDRIANVDAVTALGAHASSDHEGECVRHSMLFGNDDQGPVRHLVSRLSDKRFDENT